MWKGKKFYTRKSAKSKKIFSKNSKWNWHIMYIKLSEKSFSDFRSIEGKHLHGLNFVVIKIKWSENVHRRLAERKKNLAIAIDIIDDASESKTTAVNFCYNNHCAYK